MALETELIRENASSSPGGHLIGRILNLLRTVEDAAPDYFAVDCDGTRATDGISAPRPSEPVSAVIFTSAIALTKPEVFEACELLASAINVLLSVGRRDEASRLDFLFRDLEDRVTSSTEVSGGS